MDRELILLFVSIGLFLLTMVCPFVYVLKECRRRSESDFPGLTYGGKTISPKIVKRIWTWILVLSFVLSLAYFSVPGNITLSVEKSRNFSSQEKTAWELKVPPPLVYEIKKSDGKINFEKIRIGIPWLFLLGLFAYHRGVRKWPKEQKQL